MTLDEGAPEDAAGSAAATRGSAGDVKHGR